MGRQNIIILFTTGNTEIETRHLRDSHRTLHLQCFYMFMGPRNWFQGMNSASLCSLAGRYDNPIPPRFLAPIDFLKIPALYAHTESTWSDAILGKHKIENIWSSWIKKKIRINSHAWISDLLQTVFWYPTLVFSLPRAKIWNYHVHSNCS